MPDVVITLQDADVVDGCGKLPEGGEGIDAAFAPPGLDEGEPPRGEVLVAEGIIGGEARMWIREDAVVQGDVQMGKASEGGGVDL